MVAQGRLDAERAALSEFTLYAMDHAALETLVLRVLKAIGERDRKQWAAFVAELREGPSSPVKLSSVGRFGSIRPDLIDPFEDEPLTARRIPHWEDATLQNSLRTLAQLTALHRFVGDMGRMQGWLMDMPLREAFASDGQRAEFEALNSLILSGKREMPRHLAFLRDPDAHCSYVVPEELASLAQLVDEHGYLRQAARRLATIEEGGGRFLGRFLDRLRAFLLFAAAEGCSLYYRELET